MDKDVPTIHIRNTYSAGASAWVVGCDDSSGESFVSKWSWSNQGLSVDAKSLAPGQETTVKVPAPPPNMGKTQTATPLTAGRCDNLRLIAAVFEDGTATGDLRWINAAVGQQQKVYEDLTKARDLLKKAVADGLDRADAVKQFEDWQKTELTGSTTSMASPGSSLMYGSNSESKKLTRRLANPGPPVRMPMRPPVTGAALWLLQKKGKDIPQSLLALEEWQQRIAVVGKMPAVGTASFSAGTLSSSPSRPLIVGKPAPEFALKDVDGHEVSLKDLRGKVVFVNFWATWCTPCRAEMPQIQAMADKFKDKGLVVAGINYSENAEIAKGYFSKEKYTFLSLLDPTKKTFESFGGGGIPKVALIDKDGIVRYYQEGYNSKLDFESEVKKLGL